jgi:hypothetical protein
MWDADLKKVTMNMWRRVVWWTDTDVSKENSSLPFNISALNMEATHSSKTFGKWPSFRKKINVWAYGTEYKEYA